MNNHCEWICVETLLINICEKWSDLREGWVLPCPTRLYIPIPNS
jgi:hypothetical protein